MTLEHPQLSAGEPLPHMLDFFETTFEMEPR